MANALPSLRVDDWEPTRSTVHMWLQIVGKLRMTCTPPVNHWWHVPLYVSARGLTTGLVPHPAGAWDAEFDFVAHELVFRSASGGRERISLRPMTVAAFYDEALQALERLGLRIRIHAVPNEVVDAIPFPEDTLHASYDAPAVAAFWRQLVFAQDVLADFRSGFTGKASPVHFFWGAMDLAVTRFSGREAPPHPGGAPNCPDHVMIEGYSHELSSAGFWPGGGEEGAFYSYAYPSPERFAVTAMPEPAVFDEALGEFILPFEHVRTASDPRGLVRGFLDATFEAASRLGRWDAVRGSRPAV